MKNPSHRIFLTGGAGYIGAVLTPRLLRAGHSVTVFDSLLFGEKPLAPHRENPRLQVIQGDICDPAAVDAALAPGAFDTVIHLAAISNDPSSDLDPLVTRAVNGRAVEHLMHRAKAAGVSRFLYASSASVYGIKDTEDVTEELPLDPITVYAECKAEGERVLNALVSKDFVGVSVRAATVCGYSPRLRLDLTVNILTHQALTEGRIRVFGGTQMRPNIHIGDLSGFYELLLDADPKIVSGRAFNVSHENATVMSIAETVRAEIDPALPIEVVPTNDNRSYHLSAARAAKELGFRATAPIVTAVRELRAAYAEGRVPDPGDHWYRNVLWMKGHPERWQRA